MDVHIAVGVDRVCSLLKHCLSSATKKEFLKSKSTPCSVKKLFPVLGNLLHLGSQLYNAHIRYGQPKFCIVHIRLTNSVMY